MRISDLGEFGLIELIQQWTRSSIVPPEPAGSADYRLTVENGDDAAACTFAGGTLTEFYTTDTMVDGVHFTSHTTPWRDLGWKALASNISDIAAMGGAPAWALVTLGLPSDTPVADVAELYAGMSEICGEYGAQIIGGDMVSSPVIFVTVALTGISRDAPMLRSAAQPGHQVAITGPVGGSAGGLKLLLAGASADDKAATTLAGLHRRPRPHIAEGRALIDAGVGVAMDVSDGLADDLGKLCASSRVAARIMVDRVAVPDALKETYPDDWQELALYGGEDYVLLFTAPPEVMTNAMAAVATACIIGEIIAGTPGQVTVVDAQGNALSRKGSGWDHFANAEPAAS